MARIDFRQLTKAFPGGTLAVDSFDLEIADGEFMVLVGPSGSGKTSGLRVGAGLGAGRGEDGGAPERGGPREGEAGRGRDGRGARERLPADGPEHRDGVPEL